MRNQGRGRGLFRLFSSPQEPSMISSGYGKVTWLEEGLEAVRYVLWDATGWHRDYSPRAWRSKGTQEQKREGWEMAVRIEKIVVTVLDEAHERQTEEVMDMLSEGPERFYTRPSE